MLSVVEADAAGNPIFFDVPALFAFFVEVPCGGQEKFGEVVRVDTFAVPDFDAVSFDAFCGGDEEGYGVAQEEDQTQEEEEQ